MVAGAPSCVEGRDSDVTSPDQYLVELFARLKDEIRHAHGVDVSDKSDRGVVRGRLRSLAERSWIVRFARPLERRRGLRGAVLYPVKLCLGRLIRWYVEPFAADQRAFNDSILKLADELFEEVDVLFGRLQELEAALEQRREDTRLVAELDERVRRIERERSTGGTAADALDRAVTVAAQPRASAISDYFAFEVQMRGLSESVRVRQSRYVAALQPHAPVLDVGCGRGELLALLREARVEARGVDADADMVACAVADGLQVEQADAVEHLERLEAGSLGAIFAAQLVEHLPPPTLARFLELARTRLRPDGLLVLETINPVSPLALRNYFADLTHAQPLVSETLSLLVKQAGFRDVEIAYLNEPAERLAEVELPSGEEFDGARGALAADIRRLNELLFGPLDYALHARAPDAATQRLGS
jgi:2-polyprenyl-3-methyl-5-hydroxy-6-metoxy-1,4-benzoquinol methylase